MPVLPSPATFKCVLGMLVASPLQVCGVGSERTRLCFIAAAFPGLPLLHAGSRVRSFEAASPSLQSVRQHSEGALPCEGHSYPNTKPDYPQNLILRVHFGKEIHAQILIEVWPFSLKQYFFLFQVAAADVCLQMIH